MIVWPPGPCPPPTDRRGKGCDLAGVMLDELYTRDHITRTARDHLHAGLAGAVQGQRWADGARLLQAFVDTWPVGALIDDARCSWAKEADAMALPILGRAAEILQAAHGWSPVGVGPWPMPDADWIRTQVTESVSEVGSRGPDDGAKSTADVLGVSVGTDQPWDVLPVAEVAGDAVASRRSEVARRLVSGEIAAVRILGTAPSDPPTALALGEFRMEGKAQVAFERFGSAGLLAPNAQAFESLLRAPTPGQTGARLQPCCDGIILPGPVAAMAEGAPRNVGWLLWDGPTAPMAVQPEAVAVLQAADGASSAEVVAQNLGAPVEAVQALLTELIGLGALSSDAPT